MLISFEREDDMINVYIVNDHLYPINETLELLIQNFQGEQIQKKHIAVEVSSKLKSASLFSSFRQSRNRY